MTPSRASISIGTVSTGEISDLERVAGIATNKLLCELNSQPEGGNESAIVSSIVDELITHLPGELRRELATNLEQLKAIWCSKLMEFSRRFGEQEPAEGDVQDLVGELFTALMTYHSQAVLHHPMALEALNAGETVQLFENGYDPQIEEKHPSLAAQKGLGVGIWGLSFYASWMGITNYWGEFNKWITHKFGVTITPAVSVALRHTISILASGWISNFVQSFKEKVEDQSNATGGTTRKGIKEVTKDEHHQRGKIKGSFFIGIAALILAIDLGTNLNGVVTWFAKRPQVTEQLRDGREQIRVRLATVTRGLEEMRKIPDQVGTQVDDILTAEEDGTSETGTPTRGPVYRGKKVEYLEDQDDLTELQRTALGQQIWLVIQESGTRDGKSLEEEIEAKIEARAGEIEALLGDIERRMGQLSPSTEIEYLNEELHGIVSSINEIIQLFNEDLPEDLEKHFDLYNRLNKKIFSLLERSGKYKNPTQDKLTAWEFDPIAVDSSEVKIDDVEYVGFEDLVPVIREQFKNPAQQLTIALIACLIALAASYLDWITLHWTKRAYRDDKEKAEEHAEFMDYWITKISVVITAALNSGPFSAYFKPNTQLTDDFVRKVLERRLEAGSKIPRDEPRYARTKKIGQWIPVPPVPGLSYPLVDLMRTEPAQRHNACAKALMDIVRNPQELLAFLTEIMPGLAYIGHPETGVNMDNVRARNDQHIGGEYNRKQAEEIGTVRASIQALAERFNGTMCMEAWLSAREELFGELNKLTYICPRLKGEENIEAYTSAAALYSEIFSRHIQVLGEILENMRRELWVDRGDEANEEELGNLIDRLEGLRRYIVEDLGLMDDEEIKPVLEGVLARIDDDVARIKAIPEARRMAALNEAVEAARSLPPIGIEQSDNELTEEVRRVEAFKARVRAITLPEGNAEAEQKVAAAMRALEERGQAIARIPVQKREAEVRGVQAEIEKVAASPIKGKSEGELEAEAARLAELERRAQELRIADQAHVAAFEARRGEIELAKESHRKERNQREIQEAFQAALEASKKLPEIVSTQADRTLVGERVKLEGLLIAIKTFGTIADLDIRRQAQEAHDRIQEKIRQIDGVRTRRAREGEELRRRSAVRTREDETVATFEHFKEWERAKTSPQDDFACANVLAEYLGEEALLTGMQALGETVVNNEIADRLAQAYGKAQNGLTYLGYVDESRKKEIEAIQNLLAQDWEKLESHFIKL